jgi:ribosomal protein S18 acetylase RimI-like enzyme
MNADSRGYLEKYFRIDVQGQAYEIRSIEKGDLEAVLEVYRQCEDFLALGPVATASMEMLLKDMELSQAEGGIFCGFTTCDGKMIGILDYVPGNYEGNAQSAYLALLMIGAAYRSQGLGKAVVEAAENEIRKDAGIKRILAGVQVNNPQAVQFWQRRGYRIVGGPKLIPDQTTVYDLRKDLEEIVDL